MDITRVAGFVRPLATGAACVSLVTIALFQDVQMVLGVAVNAGILVALLLGAHHMLRGVR